ncbi:hypothetical protein KW076_12485 [Micrococcus porci]|uniref:hypothetical protein n=1 Tax=Micrococcus porci TaxID=2856555 RepID=UPI001CCEC82A|nr:hypothetical protein [Micrococcus porci]UBH24637.1 hypothetical protein KW076_12485 [Micrococcus porci]
MAWWARRRLSSSGPAPLGKPPLVAAEELRRLTDELSEILQRESARIRPDAAAVLRSFLNRSRALLPAWDRTAPARSAEALAAYELLRDRVLPGLQDWLCLPDHLKPVHADDLLADAQAWEGDLSHHAARLTQVLTARGRAVRELDERQ